MTASAIIVYGVFGAGNGALLAAVLVKLARARSRVRAVRRATSNRPTARAGRKELLPDGPAILAGTVEADGLPGPVIARRIEQEGRAYGRLSDQHVWIEVSRTVTARKFILACDSGERLLVTPDDSVLLPFPFDTIDRFEAHKRYCTVTVSPGQRVFVEGVVQRVGSTGDSADRGYRNAPSADPAPAILRGAPLMISTRPLEEHHEVCHRSYRRVAKWLALMFVVAHCICYDYHLLQLAGTNVTALVTTYLQQEERIGNRPGAQTRSTWILAQHIDAQGKSYLFIVPGQGSEQVGKQMPFVFIPSLPFVYVPGEQPTLSDGSSVILAFLFCLWLPATALLFLLHWKDKPWYSFKNFSPHAYTPLPEFVATPVVRMALTSRVNAGRSSKKRRRGHPR